jgi:hypothetical protein
MRWGCWFQSYASIFKWRLAEAIGAQHVDPAFEFFSQRFGGEGGAIAR